MSQASMSNAPDRLDRIAGCGVLVSGCYNSDIAVFGSGWRISRSCRMDKTVTDQNRLAFYKLLDETFVDLQKFPGGFYGALITLTVGVGRIQQRPLDMSSLAASLGLPRATVIRKVAQLEKDGLLEVTRRANRTSLMSTPRSREIAFPIVDRIIERIRNRAGAL